MSSLFTYLHHIIYCNISVHCLRCHTTFSHCVCFRCHSTFDILCAWINLIPYRANCTVCKGKYHNPKATKRTIYKYEKCNYTCVRRLQLSNETLSTTDFIRKAWLAMISLICLSKEFTTYSKSRSSACFLLPTETAKFWLPTQPKNRTHVHQQLTWYRWVV